MHAAIAAQAHQVQAMRARVAHGFQEHGLLVELAGRDHHVQARDIHLNDTPGADVQVADLGVTHLPFGQADSRTRGFHQRVRVFAEQRVVIRLARERDGVAIHGRGKSPAVENGEDKRTFCRHY